MKANTLLALAASTVLAAPAVEARVTKIEIKSTESPTFEGRIFGAVGAYEKLRGKAYGEVDPRDQAHMVWDRPKAGTPGRNAFESMCGILTRKAGINAIAPPPAKAAEKPVKVTPKKTPARKKTTKG